MKKILLIISLILGIFCRPTYATEIVFGGLDYQHVITGTTAPFNFVISQATPDTIYHYKYFGGIDNNNSIKTYNPSTDRYLSNNDNWNDMPTFTTDYAGYAQVEGVAYFPLDQPTCFSYNDLCYNLYISISDPDNQIDQTPSPQVIAVVSSFTPTPYPEINPTPTNIPTLSLINTPTLTSIKNPTPTSRNFQSVPTLTPTPTIKPQKFQTLATASAIALITPSGSISNTEATNSSFNIIQTGSNPTEQPQLRLVQKNLKITNLAAKVFFVFLFVSISFILYILCFFGNPQEIYLPDITNLLLKIKSKNTKYIITFSHFIRKIINLIKNLFITITKRIKLFKIDTKYFNNFSKIFFIFLKKCFILFQKIIKYYNYLSQPFLTFIKKYIKIPRKIKRYIYHKKTHILILIFFGFAINFFIKPVFASILPHLNNLNPKNTQSEKTKINTNQNFSWGVLSFNSDKSVYSIGETANLAMAVLDELGSVLCNAQLDLKIILPDGSNENLTTQNKQIIVNPECRTQTINLTPDYQSFFPITQEGKYQIFLTAHTKNGEYTIKDFFIAQENPPYVIERITSTRIYPLNSYPVSLKITANKDFSGTITEKVPSSFFISNTKAKINISGDKQLLKWSVNLNKDETIILDYTYKAPEASPELLFVGPASLTSNIFTVYQEPRQWQIAVDDITFKIQTGYFMGNGSVKSITGLGFAPEMVIVKSNTTATQAIFKTTAMAHNTDAYFMATANTTTGLITLDTDGFTLTGAAQTALARYTWIAFAGSDCTATGSFCIGSFLGNGSADRQIVTGFQPDLIWVKRSTAVDGTWRSSDMANNTGQYFSKLAQNTAGQLFTSIGTTSFGVGITNNTSTGIYYYAAFKDKAGAITTGAFNGNGSSQSISGIGFKPDFVFLKNANIASTAVYNITENYGNSSSYFTSAADVVGGVTSLDDTGFSVGSLGAVNAVGNTIYWAGFGGASPTRNSSGTFTMASGYYIGNGNVQTISNISFPPDLVVIKGDTTQPGVFRTRMMAGNSSAYLDSATANLANSIISLNHNGFSIGITQTTNTVGVTYYWTAFGNAWKPETNSGASDFYIGAYYGNGIDNREISHLPYQANLVTIKRSGASGGAFKTSQIGDTTSFFAAAANNANNIQSIGTTSFQIGSSASVNTAANIYWYFGFKNGSNFTTGSYSGNGTVRDIGTSFQPDLVWIKGVGATQAVSRYGTSVTDRALPFINTVGMTNAITSIGSTGFTIGTRNEVNTSGVNYNYVAWGHQVNYPSNAPDLLAPTNNATGVTLTPTLTIVTTDSNSDPLQYKIILGTDANFVGTTQVFNQQVSNVGWSAQNVGTSAYSSGTTASYIVQSALSPATMYYWKAQAIDYSGSNTWSNLSIGYSFTTMSTNIAPTIPTLVLPVDSAINQSLTPTFKTVTTDIESNNVQYELKICTDSEMTVNCLTFNQTSSNVGWSGQDVGTSAYASGTTATYILQVGDSLTNNTVYYWKTRAIDYTGSNTWSSTQTTAYSFTTLKVPDLTQASFRWRQDNDTFGIGNTALTLNTGITYPTIDTYPYGVTSNDLNGDDKVDLVTSDNNNITVFINNGNGAFSAGVTYPTFGSFSMSVTSKDLNNDGYFDLASASYSSNIITVFINNGNGTFNTGTTYPSSGSNPYFITSADFNKDGYFDLATADFGFTCKNITVFTNNGNGTFGIGVSYPNLETRPSSIISADFNGDDYSDLATSSIIDNNIVIYNNNGNGTFGTGTSYPSTDAFSLVSADFNGDNKPDIATANEAQTHMTVFTNNGSGLFDTGTTYPSLGAKPETITSADFNGDGKIDIATANYDGNNLTVFINNGNGTFGTGTTYPTGSGPFGIVSADINGDGLSDIATNNSNDSKLLVYTNTTTDNISWLATENVGITNVSLNSNIRLRFSIGNTGGVNDFNFRLQVAPKGVSSNCTDVSSGNFTDVPTIAGSSVGVMTTSPNFTNQNYTFNQLTDSGAIFIAGKMVEYDSNQTDSITLDTNEFTEVEYNFQMTSNAGSTTPYCFRTVNVGTTLNTYTQIAQLTTNSGNQSPSAPYLPYVNNITAQSGQQSPVYGLIDHTPAFSAYFVDPDTSDQAISYQLQIGSDTDWTSAEIWDSTKLSLGSTCNEDSRCVDIVYGGGTSLVDGSTYYWRIKYWDNSDVGGSWSDTQQFSMNNPPSVSDVVINGNNNINLSENSSIGISWTATVTDADTYLNLNTATGKIYRSGVGQSCTPDNNNCYIDANCDFVNCSGNQCTALCLANLYFFTESSAVGSTYVDEYYQAWVEATDNYTEVGSTFSTSTTLDVNTLSAFRIGTSLVYGEVFAGYDTGSSNTVTTVTNTGNSLINLEITGDYMCTDYDTCVGQKIEPEYQQYNLNSFTYGTGTTLSFSPTIINIGISKPTQSPSNSYKNLYWGIGIPVNKDPGNYNGSVTILVD